MRPTIAVLMLAAAAQPAFAQSEERIRTFFEGTSVRLKIEMPGTSEGVDVYPELDRPIDFPRHASRLKQYGTALRRGEEVLVTKIRLKKDLIEFQLEAPDGTRITRSGTVLGTAAYMAPEQLEGRDIGPATDIYALAAIAFEALGGRKPREGRTPMEIAHKVATDQPWEFDRMESALGRKIHVVGYVNRYGWNYYTVLDGAFGFESNLADGRKTAVSIPTMLDELKPLE